MANLSYSSRIIGAELPRNGKPLFISRYTLVGDVDNPKIDLKDFKYAPFKEYMPFQEVEWMKGPGIITPEMQRLLNAEPNTYVWPGDNPQHVEGLRVLNWWGFGSHQGPRLSSGGWPLILGPNGGSLLGSGKPGDGRLGVPGIDYFVHPRVLLLGKNFWEAMLYAQSHEMIVPDSRHVNTIYRFVKSEEPDPEWLRLEVERMEAGEGLEEKQIRDLYRDLRNDMFNRSIRSREILAYPI